MMKIAQQLMILAAQQPAKPALPVPDAPQLTADDVLDKLFAQLTGYTSPDFEYIPTGGAFTAYPASGIDMGDEDRAAGYVGVRVKAVAGIRKAGLLALSPPFTKADVILDPDYKFVLWIDLTEVYGDSNTRGYNVESWATKLARQLGITINNHAVSGETTNQQARTAMATMPMIAVAPVHMQLGTNNAKRSTDVTRTVTDIQAGARAIAASQFAKATIFPNQMTASRPDHGNLAVSNFATYGSRAQAERIRSGGDGGANWYFNSTNQQAGDFVTFSFTGTAFALHSFISGSVAGSPSPIRIEADGAVIKTWTPPVGMDDSGSPDACFVTGLSNVQHAIKLVFTGNQPHVLDCVSVLKTAKESLALPMYLNDIPYFANQGFKAYDFGTNVFELSNELFDDWTAQRKADLQANLPGYALAFVPINDYYHPGDASQVQGDGVHATDAGQINIQAAAYAKMAH